MKNSHLEFEALGQRVSRIEGRLEKDERSLPKRLSMWGGLVALVTSIMIGGFQIYDYTVLRKKAALEASIIQLGTYVRRISELNGKIASSALLADTPEKQTRAAAEAKIINGEKLAIVRLADRLLQEQPDAGGFASYITMAFEMLSQGNNDKALEYANAALRSSRIVPERIESMRYIAQVLFAPGKAQNIDAARRTFQKAKGLAKAEVSYLKPQLMASTLSSLVIAEVHFGDCNKAKMAMLELQKELSSKNAPLVLQAALGEIGYSLRANTNCPNLRNP